jgi:hypothetical protein
MTEREWQRQVIDVARSLGWKSFHVGDSRRQLASGRMIGDKQIAGYPDLTLVHGSRGFILAELKTVRGKLTDKQVDTLDAMAAATVRCAGGVKVHVWRPDDLDTLVMPALQGKGPTCAGW